MVSSPCLSPIGAKLTPYYNNKSANGRMELVILSQPEEQHRARYLTEGSRGAIKDVSGMSHPVVKLNGYYSRQPIKLECYIGHDKHNGLPHLFYQASKISGKNSTQCTACKVDGTSVIVMNLLPENNMQATIDCVGILKERNVDVEQKLLNLNHSNKMIDFTEQSYQNAFTSISTQQQHYLRTHLNGHYQHQNGTVGQEIPAFKFGDRREIISLHSNENSIDTMSRADSIEDSNDATRHSMIADYNQSSETKPIISDNQTSLMQNGNLNALNSRKRSVRCRLVFRVKIPETGEVLQTISTPIICTQPLGTPEICKKSISKAPFVTNNLELFIIGKNFLKDSKIVFRNKKNDWMKVVEPDKEFLNSSHLVCKVPDYDGPELAANNLNMIEVELLVRSGGKFSEAHNFIFVNNTNQQQQQHLIQEQQQQQQQQQPQQHLIQEQQQQHLIQEQQQQQHLIQEQQQQQHLIQEQQQQQHLIQEQQQQQQQQQHEPMLHNGTAVQVIFEPSPPPPPPPQQQQVPQVQHQEQLSSQIYQQQHLIPQQQHQSVLHNGSTVQVIYAPSSPPPPAQHEPILHNGSAVQVIYAPSSPPPQQAQHEPILHNGSAVQVIFEPSPAPQQQQQQQQQIHQQHQQQFDSQQQQSFDIGFSF